MTVLLNSVCKMLVGCALPCLITEFLAGSFCFACPLLANPVVLGTLSVHCQSDEHAVSSLTDRMQASYAETKKMKSLRFYSYSPVGVGGALVESTRFVRRVMNSTPVLAATYGPWASPSLAVACGALAQHPCCVGSASE